MEVIMSESTALYECKRKCHVPVVVDEHGTLSNKFFEPNNPADPLPVNIYQYQVPAGEVVSHHFKPMDDQAKEDREDQISNPAKYITSDYSAGMIAELMVDAGFFEDETFYHDKRGEYVKRKTAKRVAMESIRETIGDSAYRALLNGEVFEEEHSKKEAAIKELAKQDKKALLKMLRDADIKKGYFPGQSVDKLAAFIYDKGLCEG
jgi:hypothetical protein